MVKNGNQHIYGQIWKLMQMAKYGYQRKWSNMKFYPNGTEMLRGNYLENMPIAQVLDDDDDDDEQAPTLYDDRDPIDYRLSEIGLATSRPMAGAYQERPSDQVQY